MSLLTYAKMSELSTGRNILHLSTPERDQRLRRVWKAVMYQITHVSWRSVKEGFHDSIVAAENFFLRVIVKLGKKFSSVGDIVRGKDIPKNRGSVSFFLKNLEDHKHTQKKSL
jgi:hypothetical protein